MNYTLNDLYNALAPVPKEQYVEPAMEAREALTLFCKVRNETMVIPAESLHKWYAQSGPFKDKYGGPDYHLVYYTWAPTAKQETLL